MSNATLASDVFRMRLDPELKAEASAAAQAMGLTLSDVVRMFLVRFATDKRFPFVPEVPNKETQEAIKAGDRGEVTKYASFDDFLKDI